MSPRQRQGQGKATGRRSRRAKEGPRAARVDPQAATLVEYFEGQGRFTPASTHRAARASRLPERFIAHLETLPSRTRKRMARTLAAAALGGSEPLAPYTGRALRLMVDLCMRGWGGDFAAARRDLEREFTDPKNLSRWIAAGDSTDAADGPAAKGEWHYALMLYDVLALLRSQKIARPYFHLLRQARSREFRQALFRAREVLDRYFPASAAPPH